VVARVDVARGQTLVDYRVNAVDTVTAPRTCHMDRSIATQDDQ
jgi:hypothetical protein